MLLVNRGKSFFTDNSETWPLNLGLKESHFFLGLPVVPKIKQWITQKSEGVNRITKSRVYIATGITQE
jgi:hypothetical protein